MMNEVSWRARRLNYGKKLRCLKVGVPETGGHFARERSISACWDKQQPQHYPVAILEWEHLGAMFGSRDGLEDGPKNCPIPLLLGLVLVQRYIRILLVMHLCRLHVDLHIAVGLSTLHCSLLFFFNVYLSTNVFNLPQGIPRKFPKS